MSDTVEKIYCTDNNDALLASVMDKNNNDPMAMAANQTNTIASKICDTNYSLNNAINTLATGVERGFASTNYATQTQTCEILRDNQRNTQHIIDTLNTHWNQDLQQKYNDARLELSQVRQNQYLISQLKPTTTTTA